MYVSRLSFHSLPGKVDEVQRELRGLQEMVVAAGGGKTRILRTTFASLGAADIVFEQEFPDLRSMENQLQWVNDNPEFPEWRRRISTLLWQSPKREVCSVAE